MVEIPGDQRTFNIQTLIDMPSFRNGLHIIHGYWSESTSPCMHFILSKRFLMPSLNSPGAIPFTSGRINRRHLYISLLFHSHRELSVLSYRFRPAMSTSTPELEETTRKHETTPSLRYADVGQQHMCTFPFEIAVDGSLGWHQFHGSCLPR